MAEPSLPLPRRPGTGLPPSNPSLPAGWRTLRTVRFPGLWLTDDLHAPGHRIEWHTHPHPGCTFTVRGGYRERTAREEFACAPGMWMLKPSDARHLDAYGDQPTRSLHLMFPQGERSDFDAAIGRHLDVRLLAGGTAPRLGRRLVRELTVPDDATRLSVESLLLELCALFARQARRTSPAWVAAARARIDETFREAISLTDLAADVGAEPAELVRGFRQTFRVTPGEYLRRVRLEWADRQLRLGTCSIGRVAVEAGFHDRSHFVRAFTRAFGRRPVRGSGSSAGG